MYFKFLLLNFDSFFKKSITKPKKDVKKLESITFWNKKTQNE